MTDIILIDKSITRERLKEIAQEGFGDMVKAVVDIEQETMAIGAGMHADEEVFLLDRGSKHENLWGINIYHGLEMPDMIEFDSMINIRPSLGNNSRNVEDEIIRNKIVKIVRRLVL